MLVYNSGECMYIFTTNILYVVPYIVCLFMECPNEQISRDRVESTQWSVVGGGVGAGMGND